MTKKNVFIIFGFFMLFIFSLVNTNIIPHNIINSIGSTMNGNSGNRLEDIYQTSFHLNKTPAGNMNIYSIKYIPCDLDNAVQYAEIFGLQDLFIKEEEKNFIFADENRILYVYKSTGLLQYENISKQSGTTIIDDKTAAKLATDFINNHLLILNHEEVKVEYKDDIYTVYFINRLSNLKNYAFPTNVKVDRFGQVLSMHYYYPSFEKIKSCKIKSMEDAYYELPMDFEEDFFVDLQKCQLVYFYDDSIIQPAYLFEGRTSKGELYECFVKAALYEK